MEHTSTETAVAAIARGDAVIVVDDTDRENEGDLIFAAEAVTAEKVAFLVRHTSGVICASLTPERVHELHLPLMVADNTESHRTAFTVSVDYVRGTSTGISAADRAATLRALADPEMGAHDFARPGHVFPLRARPGGVLERPGHTEAASDLARLAGLKPYGVLCEIVDDDGSMARRPALERFACKHRLPIITIERLIAHRRKTERWLVPEAEARLPTRHGRFTARVYRSTIDGAEHVALFAGEMAGSDDVPVRVHSECCTSEVFGSLRCDCRDQLDHALATIAAHGTGALIYLRGHEGRGIGLANKLRAYGLQDDGLDTVHANLVLGLPVDARRYDAAAHIIRDLGPRSVRLLSNNPHKFAALREYGIAVSGRLHAPPRVDEHNVFYLQTKQERLGHDLRIAEAVPRRSARSPSRASAAAQPAAPAHWLLRPPHHSEL